MWTGNSFSFSDNDLFFPVGTPLRRAFLSAAFGTSLDIRVDRLSPAPLVIVIHVMSSFTTPMSSAAANA